MSDLIVKAPPGLICPKEGGKHCGLITDAASGVSVPSTPYYRRMLREGSLLVAVAPRTSPKAAKGGTE